MASIPTNFFSQNPNAANLAGVDVGTFIGKLLPNILVGAGVIFFLFIFIAGFPIISGAGRDSSPQEKAKAQAAITFAVVGFLLVVTSFFILQIIGRVVGVDFINPKI